MRNNISSKNMSENIFNDYQYRLIKCMQSFDWAPVSKLAKEILLARKAGRHIFLCGNGGSAANAMHIANDFLNLESKTKGRGINAAALPANQAVLTCLANDIGYEHIFSFQLERLGRKGDILIAFSGSGNSPNILNALDTAGKKGILSCAILGFDGGKCLNLADIAVHFPVNDMQIAEDLQLVVGHMLTQWLSKGILDESNT
jgi:D-sedoheptulose 7-phosphate isomerase